MSIASPLPQIKIFKRFLIFSAIYNTLLKNNIKGWSWKSFGWVVQTPPPHLHIQR